jgi:hypothetical protein
VTWRSEDAVFAKEFDPNGMEIGSERALVTKTEGTDLVAYTVRREEDDGFAVGRLIHTADDKRYLSAESFDPQCVSRGVPVDIQLGETDAAFWSNVYDMTISDVGLVGLTWGEGPEGDMMECTIHAVWGDLEQGVVQKTFESAVFFPQSNHSRVFFRNSRGQDVIIWSQGGQWVVQRFDAQHEPLEPIVLSLQYEGWSLCDWAIGADGNAIMVWKESVESGFAAVFDQQWNQVGSSVELPLEENFGHDPFRLAEIEAGTFVLSSGDPVSFVELVAHGREEINGPFVVETQAVYSGRCPFVSGDSEGRFVIVWGSAGIFMQRYNADGEKLGVFSWDHRWDH